jgi:hypothetical protein
LFSTLAKSALALDKADSDFVFISAISFKFTGIDAKYY